MKKKYILPILTTSIVLTSVLTLSSCDTTTKEIKKPKSILDNYIYSKEDKELTHRQSGKTLSEVWEYSLYKIDIYNSKDKKPENKIGTKTYIRVFFKEGGRHERIYYYTQDLKNRIDTYFHVNIITLGGKQYIEEIDERGLLRLYSLDFKKYTSDNHDYELWTLGEYKYIRSWSGGVNYFYTTDLKKLKKIENTHIIDKKIITVGETNYIKIKYHYRNDVGRTNYKNIFYIYYSIDFKIQYDRYSDIPG